MIVERIVTDIDEIVRMVRIPGWRSTSAGDAKFKRLCVERFLRSTCTRIRIYSIGRTALSDSITNPTQSIVACSSRQTSRRVLLAR